MKDEEDEVYRTSIFCFYSKILSAIGVSAYQLLNEDENTTVDIQNKELNEQLALINQLDEDEKNALIKIINSMLTKKRMKDLLDGKIKMVG